MWIHLSLSLTLWGRRLASHSLLLAPVHPHHPLFLPGRGSVSQFCKKLSGSKEKDLLRVLSSPAAIPAWGHRAVTSALGAGAAQEQMCGSTSLFNP